jgi:hypothetical protein
MLRNFPRENVPTACLKLKTVLSVLGNKTPSNAVRTILEGFAHASTDTFRDVCKSKIAMRGDSIYATLCAAITLQAQLSTMLDDLEQKYQQLITAKKWEGVGHTGMEKSGKSAFSASPDHKDEAESYAAYIKNKGNKTPSILMIGPSSKPVITVAIRDMSSLNAVSILLQRLMALFPCQVRNGQTYHLLPLPWLTATSL